MPIFVCDRVFTPPLTEEQFKAAGAKLAPCLEIREVRWLGSYFSADGSRSTCLYEAPNAEAIRQANHTGGAPFERVWEATAFSPASSRT